MANFTIYVDSYVNNPVELREALLEVSGVSDAIVYRELE